MQETAAKATHTPGPWHYQTDADAYTHVVRGNGDRFIVQLSQDRSGVARANAVLIAAAPEMLATLKRIVAARDADVEGNPPFDLQDRCFDDWAADLAEAAIAKAESSD